MLDKTGRKPAKPESMSEKETRNSLQFQPLTEGLGFHPFSDGLPYTPVRKGQKPAPPRPIQPMGTGAETAGPPTFAYPPSEAEISYGFGYLVRRSLAYVIDVLSSASICGAAFAGVLYQSGAQLRDVNSPAVILMAALFLVFFAWALTAAQEMLTGTSIGKRIFGLNLEGRPTEIFLRSIYFIPGLLFLGLGLIWALFSKKKRCWHDVVMDLQPIQIARL